MKNGRNIMKRNLISTMLVFLNYASVPFKSVSVWNILDLMVDSLGHSLDLYL